MATPEPSPKRSGPRSADFEPPSELSKYLPYLAAAAVLGGLVLTITRSPQYAVYAATALLTVAFAGLGYVALDHTTTLPDGDRLRLGTRVVTAAVLLAALAPTMISLYPPPAQSVARLSQPGDRAEVSVRGAAATVIVEAEGSFKPDVGAEVRAQYEITVSRGGREETVRGAFQRVSDQDGASRDARPVSSTMAGRHVLETIHGAGPLSVALDRLPDSVQAPLRVSVRAEPFSQAMLLALYGLLLVAVLWVDVKLSRRKIESAYAAAMCVVLAGTFYLHGHFTRASLPTDLLASTLVGVLGGGVGGEVLARVARAVAPGRS